MTIRTALLRGAALGVFAAVATGAASQASAAERHHHHRKVEVVRVVKEGGSSAEIQALRAEVEELKARLDAQGAAQQQTAAQVAATQSQVAEVASSTEANTDKIETIPEQVLQTVGELPKAKPSWADKTQISGRVYADFSSIDQDNNGKRITPSGTAFDIKRFYLGIDHQFNDVYSADVTTDFQYSGAIGATELYIKKAYLQAKYFPWLTIRFGATDLPWVPFVEDIYGYRYIENTLIDRTKFGTSSDFGVHALGAFDPLFNKDGPVVSYQVSVVNGTGYKAPPGTGNAPRPDTLDVEGRLSVKWFDITAAIGGYDGKLGKDIVSNNITAYHTAQRFDALLAYTKGPVRAGFEYFHADNFANVATIVRDKSEGYSIFGSYQFMPEWGVFGRYDYVEPTQDTTNNKRDNYFNFGLSYSPAKIVDLSLVYKRDRVDNGTFSTSNGVIGGTKDGTYDEIGLFTQYRW